MVCQQHEVSRGSRFLSLLLHDFGPVPALNYAVVFPGKKWPLTPHTPIGPPEEGEEGMCLS